MFLKINNWLMVFFLYLGFLFEINNLLFWEWEYVRVYIMIIYCNVYVEFVV